MESPERLARLPGYTFDRLRSLLGDLPPGGDVIDLSIGEPRQAFPRWIFADLPQHLDAFGRYPKHFGTPELRGAIGTWISRRYGVGLDADDNIIVCNGSREGLFSACMALCPERRRGAPPLALMPNPFYQVYAGAALSAGAAPHFVPATRSTGYLPRYDALGEDILKQTAIVFVCSPSNPQGSVASRRYLEDLLALARTYDFLVITDECYSEVYRHDPPTSMLEVAARMDHGFEHAVVLNSLSKRSSLPGIRCGFIAGGALAINRIKHFRSYNEPVLTVPLQRAAARAWSDEAHVEAGRTHYRQKYELADSILGGMAGYRSPQAGLFLWLDVADGEQATKALWQDHGVRVVPGRYFTHETDEANPGVPYIRVALVEGLAALERGLQAIAGCMAPPLRAQA